MRLRPARVVPVVSALALLAIFPAPGLAQDPDPVCEKTVTFALVDARTEGCLNKVSDTQWESTDLVKLNGIPLPVAPGTNLVLTAPGDDSPGGQIAVTTAITIAGVPLKQQVISKNLPAGGNGDEEDFLAYEPADGAKLFGFAVGGKVSLRIGKTAEGAGFARAVLVLSLPSILKNGPGTDAGTLTGTVAIRGDHDGFKTDALKLEVGNAYLGQLEIKSLCLSYTAAGSSTTPCTPPPGAAELAPVCDPGTDEARWDGAALIVLPTASRPQLGVFAGIRGGAFSYGGASISNLGNAVPLAAGVYLDKFGVGVCVNPPPFKIKGGVGMRFGRPIGGKSPAYLDATLEYIDSRPWTLEAKGSLALFDKQVANAYFKYSSSGAIDFGFAANLNFLNGALVIEAGVDGFYQPEGNKFNVFGHGKVCVKICVTGEIAVSSEGVAGCVSLTSFPWVKLSLWKAKRTTVTVRAGAGYRWADKRFNLMGTSCDVGPYRVNRDATRRARRADGDPSTIELKKGVGSVVRLKGDTEPPHVKLTGPTGEIILADSAGRFKAGQYLFAEDALDKSLSVTIAKPDAGSWKIDPLPGSASIVNVSVAKLAPPATAGAAVTGTGDNRTLEYLVETEQGQTITFVERGEGAEKVIGTAAGGSCAKHDVDVDELPKGGVAPALSIKCGKIDFHPDDGPGGVRKVYAIRTNGGIVVGDDIVTTYTADAQQPLAAPGGVAIVRNGDRATVNWMSVADAATYTIEVAVNDGESIVQIVPGNQTSVLLDHAFAPGSTLTVGVTGVRADQTAGQTATAISAGVPGSPAVPRPALSTRAG